MSSLSRTRKLTVTALFAAIATILQYLEFPLPFIPPFLKFDFSGVPVLIISFMFGPVQGVLVTLVKNLVRLLSTTSGGVGQAADFIILSVFAVIAALVYRGRDKKRARIACVIATLGMAAAGFIANKYLLIPFYSNIMPIEAIIKACAAVNSRIDSLNAYYLYGALPFNLVKGAVISGITLLCYKKLSVIIKKQS